MKTLHCLIDPLCGWCYAVSPALARMEQDHEINLIPTGLFSQDKMMDASWANHAWENDQRIARLTGLPFSDIYHKQILNQPTNFNSFALVIALTAVQQTVPKQELQALRVLQKARYEMGLDTAKLDVLHTILQENGFEMAAKILFDEATQQLAKMRIHDGAKLAEQLGVSGVPHVFEEVRENQWREIPSQSLIG